MAISYLSNMSIDGTLTLSVNADDATYTGIVTVDGGTLKYRTKAQIKSDIGAGSVSSVGITETGDALTITNSPITGSGDINIAGAGASTQYINGELNLVTFPSIPSVSDKQITIDTGTGLSGGAAFTLNQSSDETITITNTAPDQTVVLTEGTGITISGTYPNFTITNSSPSSGGTIGGSGTADTVAKFTAGSTIGDGPITFSSSDSTFSGNVTIGSDSATAPRLFINKVASGTSEIKFQNQGGEKASLQLDAAEDFQIFANTGQKIILRSGGADTLTLNASQGANFTSNVEADGSITGTTIGSSTQDAANIFKGSVISSVATNSLGLILRNSSDNAIIGSLLRTSASTSELTTDTLSLPGTTSQYIRGDGSAATFPTIPSAGISGSGTSGKVAKFTGSTSIGDGDITFGTNTITLGDPTSSSTATLFVDTQNRRVGYRTINPTSAFEVVGTINTQGLNCNEQQFFVDKDNTYIKAGAYGAGEFFGMTGSENQPKYTYAAGNGGKFVEDQRIETIKISQNGFYNWFTNGCVLIPAQGTNTYILVDEITVYKSAGSNPSLGAVYFGFCQQASPTSNCQMFGNNKSFDFWGSIPSQVVSRTGTWIWQSNSPSRSSVIENADTASLLNRPFLARMGSGGEASSGTFNGPWYIQIKYRNVNYIAGFQNNVDRTITSTGSGGGTARTQFLGSSVTNFSTICPGNANVPPDANLSYHFDNSSSCNGNNGYPASGDIVYTTATGSTVAAAGYIFLYSGGGKRYYIQIGASGTVQGSSCTDSVVGCDQPDS